VTDLVVGSKLRTKFEALAVEMEEQDYQFYAAVKKAIPVAVYQAFSFALLPATKAAGAVVFTANPGSGNDIVIPAGTRVATTGTTANPEKIYVTTDAGTILAGQATVSINAACTSAGTTGNTGAATITVIKTTIPGVTAVSNPVTFTNGTERETESSRRERFATYVLNLSRATDSAIEYGATTARLSVGGVVTEQVVSAKTILTGQAIADCIIYNGVGTASEGLIAEAQKIIDGYTDDNGVKIAGYKAAGVVVTAVSATPVEQDVTIATTQAASASGVADAIEEAVLAYFSTLKVGDSLIWAELVQLAMAVDGVTNCEVSVPTVDVDVTDRQVLIPGTITVT
jgi:uncharacterized phage protein gp47/JayE